MNGPKRPPVNVIYHIHSCNVNFSSSRKVESGFKRKDQVHIFKGSFLELKAAYFSNDQKQVDFLSERTFPISPLVVRSRSSLAQSHILSRAGKTEKERENWKNRRNKEQTASWSLSGGTCWWNATCSTLLLQYLRTNVNFSVCEILVNFQWGILHSW